MNTYRCNCPWPWFKRMSLHDEAWAPKPGKRRRRPHAGWVLELALMLVLALLLPCPRKPRSVEKRTSQPI